VDLKAVAGAARTDALLFGETQSRVVISVARTDAARVVRQAQALGVPAAVIGSVGGESLTIQTASGSWTAPVSELHDGWWNSIARSMA
jgi:phosphoribosylformylglycinamidine synthase